MAHPSLHTPRSDQRQTSPEFLPQVRLPRSMPPLSGPSRPLRPRPAPPCERAFCGEPDLPPIASPSLSPLTPRPPQRTHSALRPAWSGRACPRWPRAPLLALRAELRGAPAGSRCCCPGGTGSSCSSDRPNARRKQRRANSRRVPPGSHRKPLPQDQSAPRSNSSRTSPSTTLPRSRSCRISQARWAVSSPPRESCCCCY